MVIALVLLLVGWLLTGIWTWLLGGLGVLALLFTLYFFRDPQRTSPTESADLLIAPADGKVVLIKEVEHEPLYIDGPAKQVSIFLSPLNVHVNRAPATGVLEFEQYVPGEYLVAWHPKSSEKNERSELGLRHASGTKVVFKQIAGAVARRIVYHCEVGDELQAGERFGIVKFGSRMDVLVPPHVELDVELDQRVTAGETVIGRIPASAPSASAGASADAAA